MGLWMIVLHLIPPSAVVEHVVKKRRKNLLTKALRLWFVIVMLMLVFNPTRLVQQVAVGGGMVHAVISGFALVPEDHYAGVMKTAFTADGYFSNRVEMMNNLYLSSFQASADAWDLSKSKIDCDINAFMCKWARHGFQSLVFFTRSCQQLTIYMRGRAPYLLGNAVDTMKSSSKWILEAFAAVKNAPSINWKQYFNGRVKQLLQDGRLTCRMIKQYASCSLKQENGYPNMMISFADRMFLCWCTQSVDLLPDTNGLDASDENDKGPDNSEEVNNISDSYNEDQYDQYLYNEDSYKEELHAQENMTNNTTNAESRDEADSSLKSNTPNATDEYPDDLNKDAYGQGEELVSEVEGDSNNASSDQVESGIDLNETGYDLPYEYYDESSENKTKESNLAADSNDPDDILSRIRERKDKQEQQANEEPRGTDEANLPNEEDYGYHTPYTEEQYQIPKQNIEIDVEDDPVQSIKVPEMDGTKDGQDVPNQDVDEIKMALKEHENDNSTVEDQAKDVRSQISAEDETTDHDASSQDIDEIKRVLKERDPEKEDMPLEDQSRDVRSQISAEDETTSDEVHHDGVEEIAGKQDRTQRAEETSEIKNRMAAQIEHVEELFRKLSIHSQALWEKAQSLVISVAKQYGGHIATATLSAILMSIIFWLKDYSVKSSISRQHVSELKTPAARISVGRKTSPATVYESAKSTQKVRRRLDHPDEDDNDDKTDAPSDKRGRPKRSTRTSAGKNTDDRKSTSRGANRSRSTSTARRSTRSRQKASS